MTDRERATRDALVAELEGVSWMRWRLSSLEKQHLKEDFNPAFVAWKVAELEKRKRRLPDWALFAVGLALVFAIAFTPLSVGPAALIWMALGGAVWKVRWELTVYRALSTLTAEEGQPAAS